MFPSKSTCTSAPRGHESEFITLNRTIGPGPSYLGIFGSLKRSWWNVYCMDELHERCVPKTSKASALPITSSHRNRIDPAQRNAIGRFQTELCSRRPTADVWRRPPACASSDSRGGLSGTTTSAFQSSSCSDAVSRIRPTDTGRSPNVGEAASIRTYEH